MMENIINRFGENIITIICDNQQSHYLKDSFFQFINIKCRRISQLDIPSCSCSIILLLKITLWIS